MGSPDDPAAVGWRLRGLESTLEALGPAVGQVARLDAEFDALSEDVRELRDTAREFRAETRTALDRNGQECRDGLATVNREIRADLTELRRELRADRTESRNRSFYLAGPIALAALGIFAKVVLGIDLHI